MKIQTLIIKIVLLCLPLVCFAGEELPRYIDSDAKSGRSQAVIVGDVPLVHTAMVTGDGLNSMMDRLGKLLEKASSSESRIVKLNVYATTRKELALARTHLAKRLQGTKLPAVSEVVSKLPGNAQVAVDAVATTEGKVKTVTRVQSGQATVTPRGVRIYISGQAARHADLGKATRETLAGLRETLTFLGRTDSDILQIKAFLQPMTDARIVLGEVEKFYGKASTPPVVLVEWLSSATTPIEIELVAWGGAGKKDSPSIEYLTPPGLKASPVFSRIARVNRTPTIYVSSQAGEVEEVYESLEKILQKAGSDLKHLAKATYYVTDNETSSALGALRTKLYDPKRPPAASKATVTFAGANGEQFSLDMIAVPAQR